MPRDNESLIDIERAARRVLRYASGSDRAELETNDEKRDVLVHEYDQIDLDIVWDVVQNKLPELLTLLQPLLPFPEN